MINLTPQEQNRLQRLSDFLDLGEVGVFKAIDELSEKVDDIKEELKKKPELLLELDKEELKGDDYILTEKDKLEIASKIKVPIVEKVVERTEVVKEQPIIKNEIVKETVTIEKSNETGETIIDKINSLPVQEEYQIDAKHIKNLPKPERGDGFIMGANRNLYQLLDVNVEGLTLNQTIKWNGTQWVPADLGSGSSSSSNYFDRVGTTVDFANHNDVLDTTSDAEAYTISGTAALSFHYEPDSSWYDDGYEYKVRVYGVKNGLYTQNYIESNSLYAEIFDTIGVDLVINANEVFDSFAFLLYLFDSITWKPFPDVMSGYYGIEGITSTTYSQTYTGGVLDEGTDKLDGTVTPNVVITNEYSLKTDKLKAYGIIFDNTYYTAAPISGDVNFLDNVINDGNVTTTGTTTSGTFVSDTYNFASFGFPAISYDLSNGLSVGGGDAIVGGIAIGVDSTSDNGISLGNGANAIGTQTVSIGQQCSIFGIQTVGIGAFAGGVHDYSISIGSYAGFPNGLTQNSNCTYLGWGAGSKVTGDGNIFLGYKAGYHYSVSANLSNTFIVNSQDTTDSTYAILYGTMTDSPLTQTLSVNGILQVATNLSPKANDNAALGTTSLMWSDLFLASGGVINFNNGDVTVTHSANTLAFAGASTGYTFDAPVNISSSLQCDSIVNDTGLAHGTYTPTITNVTNVAASTAYVCHYARVGNQVWVFGKVDIDQTAAGAYEIGISLPIASNLAATTDLAGHATSINATGISDAPYVEADTTNDRASFKGNDTDISNHAHHFHFMYTVI